VTTEEPEEEEYHDGYHSCPCCEELLCGGPLDEVRCDSCVEAGCEAREEDGVFVRCEVPVCPCCETPSSFMNDKKWHDNCDDPDDCEKRMGRRQDHA
jgi:hypothetical protein